MTRSIWTAALAVGTVLAAGGLATAQPKAATITLGGKGTAAQAATQDNEEARWGGHRHGYGGWGGYRYGGWGGSYGGYGYGGYNSYRPYYSSYGYGYGYGYGNYRPYYGYNSYRPYYGGHGHGYGHGYGHGHGWRGISGEAAPVVNLGGPSKPAVEPTLPSPFSGTSTVKALGGK